MCAKCDDRCSCRNAQLSSEEKKNAEDSNNFVFPRSSSQLSAISIMSESNAPDLVYKRKKLPENSVTILSASDVKNLRTGDCLSFIHSDAPSYAGKDQYVHFGKGELSAVSIMSESTAPNFVYKRRKLQENSVTTLSACDAQNPKTGDCLSSIHSDAPSLAGKEQYVHSQKGELSAVSIMSESTAPNFVYKRRKVPENSVTILSACDVKYPRTGDCLSFIHSDAPSLAGKDQHVHSQKGDPNGPCLCNRESTVLKSQSFHGFSVNEELVSDKTPKASVPKGLEVDSVNDSCSSSKSNMENVSTSNKTEVDETAECSSSSAIVMEAVGDLSEKDFCISILRTHGLLGEVQTTRSCESAEDISTSKSCQRSCKICNRSETAQKLLICDNCEEAFHMSCCQPRIKKVPIDEWFCHSCLKEKHTLLNERVRKFPNITSVMSRNASSKDEVNPILLMLRDTEPYRTSVRVGKGFQADVHDWSGPINNDGIGEPLELHPSEHARLHELSSSKPSKARPISNWIQCREVVDPEKGIRCGKWRRAPLFEVQTNNWECFCSILWDPSQADCNVPQELETDEVLKQLKYVETLRPRLSAQQHNLGRANSTGDLQNRRIDTKSLQTL
ncbi:PREDICTED: uncharacterized protein LOC101314280 isoform X1 [Fragaria vesca subsp. vesca]|uniref:uncharacterized protein LOC101314280 isoform X1 n=1 Tax=Fragaria vesca subsp. vesca TaxID=101020 RepID=UPI0002C33DB8|nr:PREDICTED: uncharacterized protein LOC101314280 isoform X1 [Fragaria vesca subsp. vesca]XP_011464946.1 PREDICTED: uncharacterized protein LOC101314280 isoform X1 [Fragaria vesca subsp. vesca]